jgi:hypothetical protein
MAITAVEAEIWLIRPNLAAEIAANAARPSASPDKKEKKDPAYDDLNMRQSCGRLPNRRLVRR